MAVEEVKACGDSYGEAIGRWVGNVEGIGMNAENCVGYGWECV